MSKIELTPLPPAEAVKFFESKGYKVGFDWRDTWGQEHARAFTVAKAMRRDILEDIRAAMDSAIRDGTTFNDFRQRLTPILQEKGWWGRTTMTDPLTGESKRVQLGSPRRLRTIFDTNMRTAHAAGRWERIQRSAERRPYLRYVAVQDERTRPEHLEWHGTVLRHDDPWWETHYPPNGWNCRCQVMQLSERDMERFGFTPNDTAPPSPTVPWRNPRTGETARIPKGIDPGFGHNSGIGHVAGLATPPRSGPLPVPFKGDPARVGMPPPRSAPASAVLPRGLSDEAYVDGFLGEFGAARGKPAVFTDLMGEPLAISESLFTDRAGGGLKVQKNGREQYLPLLARTIKEPDEIWWYWEIRKDGSAGLRRRYLARFNVEEKGERQMISAFDVGKDGWSGVTTFSSSDKNYLLKQRRGTLGWRRT
jgi:SPP1 gp7 family putative phage head morphogenesis protein